MSEKRNVAWGISLIWVSAFILANIRGTVVWDFLRQGLQLANLRWVELFFWVVAVILVVWVLIMEDLINIYKLLWIQNKVLAVFVFVILLSVFWSVSPLTSLHRGLEFLCCTLVAAYLGTYYTVNELRDLLFRFGSLLLIVSFVIAMFLPLVGVMSWEPYTGSWRGIFWHKNHFAGIVVLFSAIFLIDLLAAFKVEKNKFVVNAIFYLFSLVLVYLSRSAAGHIIAILIAGLVITSYAWLKIRHRLRPNHYYGILTLVVFSVIIAAANLNFLLGLFGRDATLTGRSSLWLYLLRDVVTGSPWFGYGFGAIWNLQSFRSLTQGILGWGYPVVIADNGFLDILLHVGGIGFALFLGVLGTALLKFVKYALWRNDFIAFSPLIIVILSIFVNISFSFFLEIETFVWLVVVAMMFAVNREFRLQDLR